MRTRTRCLVVGLPLHPGAGAVAAEEILPALIVDEDEDREGEGGKPPVDVQRVHPETLVHARTVGQEGGQESFEAKSKVQHAILHALLEHRVLPGLADDQVRPLHDHDGHEEGCVASVLQDLSVPVGQIVMLGRS